MRVWLAHRLHGVARWLYNDTHTERVTVIDEYGICRCRIEIAGDDSHGISAEFIALPDGWVCETRGNENV